MNKIVELNPEFTRVDGINAPHCFAYGSNQKIVLRSVDGSMFKVLFKNEECGLSASIAWSGDGSTLYHAHDQIYAIDAESTSHKAITSFPEKFSVKWHLYYSRINSRLVFYCDTTLLHIGPEIGESIPLTELSGTRGWFSISPDSTSLCAFPALSKFLIPNLEYFWWHSTLDKAHCLLWKEEVPMECLIRVWAMDALGGNRLLLASFPQRPMYKFVLSPDGKTMVYTYHFEQDLALWGEYAGLYLRSLPDGVETLVSQRGKCPAWSPLGDKFAYIADAALWLYEPKTNAHKKIVAIPGADASSPVRSSSDSRGIPTWSWDGRFIAFWLHKPNKGFWERKQGELIKPGDIEDRHGLVDLERKQVFILDEGYWEHVSWQPSLA